MGKKKLIKTENLLNSASPKTLKKILQIHKLLNELETENKAEFDKIFSEENQQLEFIPTNIFNDKLGILESIVKYLKENKQFKLSEIAKLIERDQRTIWNTYDKAKKKYPKQFAEIDSEIKIPIEIFHNRNLGPLEILTIFLKENKHMKFKDIANLLKRDPRTIWSSYNKGVKKR